MLGSISWLGEATNLRAHLAGRAQTPLPWARQSESRFRGHSCRKQPPTFGGVHPSRTRIYDPEPGPAPRTAATKNRSHVRLDGPSRDSEGIFSPCNLPLLVVSTLGLGLVRVQRMLCMCRSARHRTYLSVIEKAQGLGSFNMLLQLFFFPVRQPWLAPPWG